MESDLRTPAARLRAGLDNLSAAPPSPSARPLPRATAGQPRPLGALLGGPSGDGRPVPAVAESESVAALRPERPRAGGGHRRRYVLRRKLEPLACWPAQYAKLPRRAWDDPRLHQGAKLTLAVILCAARGRRQFATYKRSLAADALAAADRRLRRTHSALGLGPVGITIPTPMIQKDSEPPAGRGSSPDSA